LIKRIFKLREAIHLPLPSKNQYKINKIFALKKNIEFLQCNKLSAKTFFNYQFKHTFKYLTYFISHGFNRFSKMMAFFIATN